METLSKKLLIQSSNDGIHRVCVGAIILHDSKFLLLKRKAEDYMGGLFELPSGKIEENESISNGLIREVHEETNLFISKIVNYINFFDYFSLKNQKTRQHNFLVKVKKPFEIQLTEHSDYIWIEKRDVYNYYISDEVRVSLKLVC